jgi:hypothetical protein
MRHTSPERLRALETYIDAAERLPETERVDAMRRLAQLDRRWERMPAGIVAAAGVVLAALLAAIVLVLLMN